jgi:hypothetical protein
MYTSLARSRAKVGGAYGFCPGVAGEVSCSIDFLGQALRDITEDEMRESGSTQPREFSPWALQADRSGQEVPVLHCTAHVLNSCAFPIREIPPFYCTLPNIVPLYMHILSYVVFPVRKM